MKIGIVTFHDALNYGAVLQAYALRETLKTQGAEPECIGFAEKRPEPEAGSPEQAARLQKYPRLLQEREKMRGYRRRRTAIFAEFSEKYLHPREYAKSEPVDHLYDRFLVGSDQVWNYQITNQDPTFFLDFAPPDKRFAYAASFGLDHIPAHLHAWYAALAGFAKISVREQSGRHLVKTLSGRDDARVCLDPTLLLTAREWAALTAGMALPGLSPGRYALLYLVNFDVELIALARQTAEAANMPLKIVTADLQPPLGPGPWLDTGVTELVLLLQQAAVVLTDSFHGLALSLTFEKEFFLGTMGLTSSRAGRLHNLLELTGITIREGCPAAFHQDAVAVCLENEREKSLEYLREILA